LACNKITLFEFYNAKINIVSLIIKMNLLKMKKYLTIYLIFFSLYTNAQKIKYFKYYLTKDFVSTEKKEMEIYGEGKYENNSFKLNCFSPDRTKLLMTAYFKDSSLAYFDGEYILYHYNGNVDTKGKHKMNEQIDLWQKWDSTGNIIDSTIYENGKVIIKGSYYYELDGKLISYKFQDFLNDTYKVEEYDSSNSIISKADFKGNNGIFWRKTTDGIKQDSVFTREDFVATFRGGPIRWKNYLELEAIPSMKYNELDEVIYNFTLRFTVEEDGSITDIVLVSQTNSVIEKEWIKIIKKNSKWVPALRYGIFVKSVVILPITFFPDGNYFIKERN
jgi:antitoxin component YwqK of YwqJK toxin-antitoxin module